jgi:hypothetical protein
MRQRELKQAIRLDLGTGVVTDNLDTLARVLQHLVHR